MARGSGLNKKQKLISYRSSKTSLLLDTLLNNKNHTEFMNANDTLWDKIIYTNQIIINKSNNYIQV